MRNSLLWVIGSLFLIPGGVCIARNLRTILRYLFDGKQGSMVPLAGGLFVSIGILIVPLEGLRKWCWLPLFLDYGSLPTAAGALWAFVRRRKQ